MYKVMRMSFMLLLCFVLVSQIVSADSIQNVGKNARINWTEHYYTATGQGAVPDARTESNRARAFLKAKTYAKMQAIANLLMAIEGTTINYEANGKDFMADETIRQTIEGFVRNVEEIKTETDQIEGSTVVTVTVKAPMFGNNAPGSVILNELKDDLDSAKAVDNTPVKVVLKPDKPVTSPVAPIRPASSGPYTSLIINTTGYKLERCMSPKIRRTDGSEVWGTVKADWDFVQDHGIVAYTTTLDGAVKNRRAGTNPLVIKAIGRSGGKFNSDPVISDADAELILAEDSKSGFLSKFNVIFVKDGRL